MDWRGLPVVIFGSGGISKEVYSIIEDINRCNNVPVFHFLGFVEDTEGKVGNEVISGHKVITDDNQFEAFSNSFATLGVVIPIGNPNAKINIYNKIKGLENIVYPNIIHPRAQYNENTVILGYGNVITAGATLTCNITLGNFNLINLNTTVGHDTVIGNFNVINPLVAVSGDIVIKDGCLIGTGAKILQQLKVDEGSTIGAGAVVVKDVEAYSTVVGIPAKKIK
ncbi:NeuD/PglB/VioB family sugar acetyltransferase [Alkalihalobacterium bogoriense]|uniref:NeuD/PglB/VioB family sugar acetyltransferase n=1 Tax=Alkalihalobacterium bogoriense TaxID=246272 RepID=UPI00047DABD1|nr:NeuD/PglB/VioB family sugar acetyltransferase [Alkalihalobacterium bogoriense]